MNWEILIYDRQNPDEQAYEKNLAHLYLQL